MAFQVIVAQQYSSTLILDHGILPVHDMKSLSS